jgi:hypothetical protein
MQHLRCRGVASLVLVMAERQVRVVGVDPGVLECVRLELRIETDAPALLSQVKEVAAGFGDALDGLAQLRPTVAPLAAEYVTGEALAVGADQRYPAVVRCMRSRAIAQRERKVLAAVDEPVEAEYPSVGGVSVGEPKRQLHLGANCGGDGPRDRRLVGHSPPNLADSA